MSGTLKISLGGVAVVCCVHDREKRQVTDPEQVRFLGSAAGIRYDAHWHKLQTCACCQNLFVAPDDTPRLCGPCSGEATFTHTEPLPAPLEGAI